MLAQPSQNPFDTLAEDLVDSVAQSCRIGADREGDTHHWHAPANAVVVFNGRELDGLYNLDSCGALTLHRWIIHVHKERGWASLSHNAELAASVDEKRKAEDA